tara:strand:- start:1237 stop:1455 length:219 start_codon:yes stop_codon:yes gene_type:complete
MTKTPKDLECFELMSPEEQEQYLAMLGDIADLGPKPTREATLRTLMPHLQLMFGDGYDDYKGALEATYGDCK